MIRIINLILFTIVINSTAQANDLIVGGLSSKNISINTTFSGSDIFIFGSIKRNNNKEIIPSDIIIEVLGPKTNLTVRKKKKMFGIWVNSDPYKIIDSPSFYSLIYTDEPENILSDTQLAKTLIGKEQFFRSKNLQEGYFDAVNANIRIKSKDGSYLFNNDPITLKGETLFSARVSLPANLTEGDYETKIHLVQNNTIVNSYIDFIKVRKIGVEKWLYNTAHEEPLFYGIFSIFLALFFGWGASTLFRRFQK